jgi:hypothetical protein
VELVLALEIDLLAQAVGPRGDERALDAGDGQRPEAIAFPSFAVSAARSDAGMTRSTIPMASASAASTMRPVIRISIARLGPTRRGRNQVPPQSG